MHRQTSDNDQNIKTVETKTIAYLQIGITNKTTKKHFGRSCSDRKANCSFLDKKGTSNQDYQDAVCEKT